MDTLQEKPVSEAQPSAEDKPKLQQKDNSKEAEAPKSEENHVKLWQQRVSKAKDKWKNDFDRMRENMDFVAGIQWPDQHEIRYDKYIVNMTLRAVNQGVAMLYAKDPKVSAKRRSRLDFQMWDGKLETIQQANAIMQLAQQAQGVGVTLPVPPEIPAMLQDFQQGTMRQKLVEKVGKTLEIVCQYQIDTQQPRFKTQMKQLVRRVNVTGVGYIKVLFCRDYESELTQSETRTSIIDRAKLAKALLDKMEKEPNEESADVERLKALVLSMGTSPLDYESVMVREHLVFDFPQATSIIPDPKTRSLKGFVGAKWVAEEYYYPLEFVNSFFEVDIKAGGDVKTFSSGKQEEPNTINPEGPSDAAKKSVRLWEITDLETKSRFIICDGWKEYVQAPELLSPVTKGFWNIVPVTFNDVEVEDGCKASIFPPSAVDLLWSSQKEWNRVREGLKKHRKANAPRYLYPDGAMDQEDLDRIADSEDQEFIKIKGSPPGTDPSKILSPLSVAPIDASVYDTEPLREDALLATGQQEANIGPAQPNVTATVGTIAEQSRMSVAASDVDGLDDSLTDVFQCGGEMLLREMSGDTVKKIAGVGAVWPEQNSADFINEIELEVVAASSGRPNKAIEVANWERLGPLLMQAGANPQAIIRESIKRLDDRLDPADFFPLPQMAPPAPSPGEPASVSQPSPNQRRGPAPRPSGGPKPNRQPLQPSSSGVAVPLAGH